VHDKRAAKAHEGGAFGRLFVAGKTAKAAEARPVRESDSANATSERSYQVASKSALNIAKGGQAFSPFTAG
jgi:hypothetical protein